MNKVDKIMLWLRSWTSYPGSAADGYYVALDSLLTSLSLRFFICKMWVSNHLSPLRDVVWIK